MRFASILSKTAACAAIALSNMGFAVQLKQLKPTKIEKPGFLFSYQEEGYNDLLVASFAPFGTDKVLRLTNPFEEQPEIRSIRTLTKDVIWPNEIKSVPASVLGSGWVTVAGGFLVPGKGQGAITLLNIQDNSVIKLTQTPNFFYHRVEWHDMNQDGRLDIVTARANKPMVGNTETEMLWLEQPQDLENGIWNEHFMVKGPDVFFRGGDLNQDGKLDFVVTEFFGKKLSFISYENGVWERTIIDDTIGHAFDLSYVDLNRDGKTDLLVTNHEAKAEKAAVFAYEFPEMKYDSSRKSSRAHAKRIPWRKHVLLSNIPTTQKGMNQASPGEAIAFSPHTTLDGQKPWIAVAGDGSQKLWLLQPVNQSKNDWNYKFTTPVSTSSTIGRIEVADLDHDGWKEIYVPAYDANEIYTLKFID